MTLTPRSEPGQPLRDERRSPLRSLIGVVLRVSEAAVVGLFVAGTAAQFVSPSTLWELQAIAVGVPYLALAVGIVAVGSALGRRWVPASAYALILGIGQVLTLRAGTDSVAMRPNDTLGDRTRLTVMTFNAKPSATGPSQEAMGMVLARYHPHVIALQEFPVRTFHDSGATAGAPLLIPLLAGGVYKVSVWGGGGDRNPLPIFARIDSAAPAQLLAGEPAEGLWASGGIARAEYEWDGQKVAIYSVHLHSFSEKRPWEEGLTQALSFSAWSDALHAYRNDFRWRAEQARRLRALLEAEPYPYLVCGDLNSMPNNWVYGHLATGLTDAFKVAGRGWGMTFPSGLPLVRIDFVLASNHWDIHEARVERGIYSDHFPVIVQLSLRR